MLRSTAVTRATLFAGGALILSACVPSSCTRAEQSRDVALGWRGTVDPLWSRCHPSRSVPTFVVPAWGNDYTAVALGSEDFMCERNMVVHVHVRRAVRLEIDMPATLEVGRTMVVRVVAYDGAGHDLDIGSSRTTFDRLEGVLERHPCSDMDSLCGIAGDEIQASGPGKGRLVASFGGLTATHDITAHLAPPGDAGGVVPGVVP